jgi:DNA polymerase-3 subunit epsilon
VSLLARWLGRKPDSDLALAARREWSAASQPSPRAPCESLRFVAVDTETSGLDPARDRLISIGACVIEAGAACIGESFEVLLRQDRPSTEANVLIHGIGHGRQAAGDAPERALAAFLAFARRDVLIGYHTAFDVMVLDRAMRAALGLRFRPVSLDLALLLPGLEAQGAGWELDQWLARYGLRPFARHDALADAAVTGELFLIALSKADARGLRSLGDLVRLQRRQIELQRLTPH